MGRDTIRLETAVSTITQEYLLEFTSKYGISENLYPELPGREDRIVDFPEGKVGVYTKFFDFANYRIPISQFLFDILGHYQIHLSQLSVIGAAKMSFGKRPRKDTPQCYTKPLDSLKNWNNRFFWVDERVFPTVVDWRISAPKDGMPVEGSYSVEDVAMLNTRHMDLFNLISAPNPAVIKTGTRSRAVAQLGGGEGKKIRETVYIEKSPAQTVISENPSQQAIEGDEAENLAQETVASETPCPPGKWGGPQPQSVRHK
ncbi:hypothetical protein Tco_0183825 [Tanacetum coccineum]